MYLYFAFIAVVIVKICNQFDSVLFALVKKKNRFDDTILISCLISLARETVITENRE